MINGLALLISVTLSTGDLAQGEHGRFNSCPSENQQAHEIAVDLATTPAYAAHRARLGMPQVTSAQVRLLTGATDAAKCTQMLENARHRAVAWGGTLEGATPVFYQAAGYYFAVMTYPPKPQLPPPPPGYHRVRLGGWIAVYVFSSDLSVYHVLGV